MAKGDTERNPVVFYYAKFSIKERPFFLDRYILSPLRGENRKFDEILNCRSTGLLYPLTL